MAEHSPNLQARKPILIFVCVDPTTASLINLNLNAFENICIYCSMKAYFF